MSFSDKLKNLRKEKGMTQEELGELIGVKKAAIQKLESGSVQSLKVSNIKILCEFFNISPNELILEKEDSLAREVFILDSIKNLYGKESVQLLEGFINLNQHNKEKVIEYCNDLTTVEKFKSSSST